MSKLLAIPGVTITDAILTSNSISETVPAYNASTVYVTGDQVRSDATHRLYQSVIGVASTVTITNATPGVVTYPDHGYPNNTAVIFTTAGTLPSPLVSGTTYYVVNRTDNTFQVAATKAGAAINTTTAGSGTHTATMAPNKGYALTDTTKWVDVGPTNPWAAFDIYKGTVARAASPIVWTFAIPDRVNSISFFGLENVTTIQVEATVAGPVTVYDETFNLNSSEEVGSWWDYFFAPISTSEVLFVGDLPPEKDKTITVTVTGTGTIGVGTCSIGTSRIMGDVQYGAGVSIIDYGKKVDGTFQEYEYIPGGWSLQNDYTVTIERPMTSRIVKNFKDLLGKPIVWIGSDEYGCTYNFGPFTNFKMQIAYPNHSVYTFNVEGLA